MNEITTTQLLANNLRVFRKAKNLTAAVVQRKTGIKAQRLSNIELNLHSMTIDELHVLCNLYEVSRQEIQTVEYKLVAVRANADEQALLSCPGDTIIDTMLEMGLSKTNLSALLGVEMAVVDGLLYGSFPITHNLANKLQQVLKIDASFWLNRDKLYRTKLHQLQNP